MAPTVLVVEDEPKLRNLIRTFLEREHLLVLSTGSGAEAIALGMGSRPDLVVLDLGLPDIPGGEVARELRRGGDPLVLMLTALATEADRIRGFELGADDYLVKPFSPRELVLRALALLRRGRASPGEGPRVSFGGGALAIDADRHELWRDDRLVKVSPTEWGIIATLARTPGRVYSRYELVNAVRGQEWEGYERVIDSHVKNLRRKLGDQDQGEPRVIETVLGVGYRLGLRRDP